MLIIRREQMEALKAVRLDTFVEQLEEFLRHRQPAPPPLTRPELRALIEAHSARAASYGMSRDPDLQRYFGYVIELGGLDPCAVGILRQSKPAGDKLAELEGYAQVVRSPSCR